MANPGVYFPYASDATWPFLALVGVLFSVPLLGFAILMMIVGHVSRIRSVAAAILTLAIAAASVWGLIKADSDFRAADIAHRIAYVEEVSVWLARGYGVILTEAELSEVLTPQGVSGQFEGATAFITIRGDSETGNLVVTDRNGVEVPPIQD